MGVVAKNLSSGSPTKSYQNQPAQLHSLPRILHFLPTARLNNYNTFHLANDNDAEETVWMPRVVYVFVICKPPKIGFLT